MIKSKLNPVIESHVAILHRISRTVSSGLKLDQILQELIRIAVEGTACDACLVYLAEPLAKDMVLRASQLPHSGELGKIRLRFGEGITGWVAEHKTAVALAQDSFADKRFKFFNSLVEDTYHAFLSVPLVQGGETIGVLICHHKEPHLHAPEEIALLAFLGEQMGGVIAMSRLAAENAHLQERTVAVQRQLASRKLLERAKAILQQRYRISEEEAYLRLRNESRRRRRPLRELAELVLMVEGLALGNNSPVAGD